MKKIINNILIGVALTLMVNVTSCLDLTEAPENTLIPETFYQDIRQCEAALTGSMSALIDTWGGYNEGMGYTDGQRDGGGFGYTSSYANDVWTMHWRAISNINPVIKSINAGTLGDESQSAVNDLLGQAYMLRAWNYFWLVQLYGKLPWVDENTVNLVDVEANPLTPESRLDIAQIYDKIEADLNNAFNLMGDYNSATPAKPCKWTAKAWLAKVYLTRATAPLNQTDNFAKARDAADEVIQSGRYNLIPIADIFKTSNPNNAEFIFAFQFTEDFPGEPGKAFGPEDDWDQWGAGRVNRFWAEEYPDQPRKHYYLRTAWPMNIYDEEEDWEWIYYTEHPSDGERDPWDGKKCWPNMTLSQNLDDGGNSGILLPILRISEMYLIYAEGANNANNGPTDKAVEYLNMIIDRANEPFDTPYEGITEQTSRAGVEERASMSMSKDAFNEKVFLERQWELCFEFTAYFDLLRHRRLKEWVSQHAWDPDVVASTFDESDYLFPIPEYDAGFIGNNPGY